MNIESLGEQLAALRSGRSSAGTLISKLYQDANRDDQNVILNHVAAAAATSEECLGLLLALVDDYRVSIPAIRKLLGDDAQIEDVSQDSLVALAESIQTFEARSSFRTWFGGIARNQALQHIRRSQRSQNRELAAAEERPSHRISSLVAGRETLAGLLDSLPAIYREAVVLRDLEGLAYEEIAQTLAIELNTVRSRIARGRALLAAKLNAAMPNET